MLPRSDTVLDENNIPVPGANVYVYDINGNDAVMTSDGTAALVNPIQTDEFGGYSYYANTGYYSEDIWFGGRRRWREHNIAIGNPGADLNMRTDLAASTGAGLVGAVDGSSGSLFTTVAGFIAKLLSSAGAASIGYINGAAGTIARSVQALLAERVSLTDFGADPTGATSSDAAISAWLALAGTKHLTAPAGTFTFSSVKAIAAADNIRIEGAGRQKTRFVYTGAATTGDLWTIGDGTTALTGLHLSRFNIDSTTTMTSGAALRIRKAQNGNSVRDVSFSQLHAIAHLWDAARFDCTNVVDYVHGEINCQHDNVVVNGTATDDTGSDLTLDKLYIVGGTNGVHCGGGFGGLYLGDVLIFGCSGAGYLQDNSVSTRGNREIFMSDECKIDSCGVNVLINETGSGASLDCDAFLTGASATDNLHIQAMPTGIVSVGANELKSAARDGIRIDDATTFVNVAPQTYIRVNGGWGLNATVATTSVKCGATFLFNTSGDIHSNVGVGTVTQATSKSTAVTLNGMSGQIATNNAALASSAVVTFTVNNVSVRSTACIDLTLQSGNATAGTYRAWPEAVSNGSFKINIQNISGGSLSEALVLNFIVKRGVAA